MQEARFEKTPEGQVPADDGWFIRNLGELAWETVPGFGVWRALGVGLHVHVLQPGEAGGYYHAEDAAYAAQIHYWTTPIAQCLDGRTDVTCTDYGDWTTAWTEVKG